MYFIADFDANSDIGFTDFGDLPFGACEDPVRYETPLLKGICSSDT